MNDTMQAVTQDTLGGPASPGAQAAMLAYMRRTEDTGDLPLYDRPTYNQTLKAGRFAGEEN